MTADDKTEFTQRVRQLLSQTRHSIELPARFTLQAQTDATLAVYQSLLDERG